MDRELAKRLTGECAARYNDAARKLLEQGDVDAANAQLKWIETSGKVLASTKHAAMRQWAVVITFACLVLAGLAWTLRIAFAHVTLDLVSSNVVMTTRQDWTSDYQFEIDRLLLDNLTEVKAPGLNLTARVNADEEAMRLELQGTGMTLYDLGLQASAIVELSADGHEITLYVKNAQVTGRVDLRQARLTVDLQGITEERSVQLSADDPSETVEFTTAAAGAAPVQIRFTTRQDWRLRGLHVQALGFVEEYPPGSGNFESVIRSGRVAVLETGMTKELQATDALTLRNAKSRRFELLKTEDGVQVIFEGNAARILSGPPDFAENLTPTWLEYIYHQQRLKVFWGAVLFLSGLLWRIRNTIWSA